MMLNSYSREYFQKTLQFLLEDIQSDFALRPEDGPKAILLGGQSGAGKTTLHEIIHNELAGNVVIINADEYRSLHPHYRELDSQYGPDAVKYTAKWSGETTEALIAELSQLRYNLIVEGTLRTTDVPMRTAKQLRDCGYAVSLALMGVKPEISLISCQIRYEQMRIAGTVPRATDPEHHNRIVREIVNNLDVLAETDLFDDIRVYSRAKRLLYPLPGEVRTPGVVLQEVLFGAWTEEEEVHLAHLQEELEQLRKS